MLKKADKFPKNGCWARLGLFLIIILLLTACGDTATPVPATTTPAATTAATIAAETTNPATATSAAASVTATEGATSSGPVAPAWFKDVPLYEKAQPLTLDEATLSASNIDPARFVVKVFSTGDPVTAVSDFYVTKLKDAGWQLTQKVPIVDEKSGQQLNLTRTQNGTNQGLIVLIGTAQGLGAIPQTAPLAAKIPAGQTLLVILTLAEPVSPPTTGLPAGVAAKNFKIDFGDGWVAEAQLTYPSSGSGPFPTVILVHGSGANDMDETLPESAAGVPGGSKTFRSIAYYLPTRGFAVLRYNKRGVVGIGPQPSTDPKFTTLAKPDTQYTMDAAFVLKQSLKDPLVDSHRVIMLGHSEGTLDVSHVAASADGQNIAGVVLMGVMGYDIKTTLQYQLVDKYVIFYQQYADTNKDGKLSVEEALNYIKTLNPVAQKGLTNGILVEDKSSSLQYKFPATVDLNGDGLVDLQTELKPVLQRNTGIDNFPNLPAFGGAAGIPFLSDLQQNGSVTGVIGAYKGPVLMLNGEADFQTVVQGAREADAALAKAGNKDHTLITYPGLGHTFYPAKGLDQPLGPIQDNVLKDMGDWLTTRFGK